jgi:hypothetical protein
MRGVGSNPFWLFIPISRYLLPVPHDLLGLGDNVLDYLWAVLDERWEPQTDEERQVYTKSLASEVAVQKTQQKLDEWYETDFCTREAYAIESPHLGRKECGDGVIRTLSQ